MLLYVTVVSIVHDPSPNYISSYTTTPAELSLVDRHGFHFSLVTLVISSICSSTFNMPFWRRRNKQHPASLSFHSTEHLQQSNNPRFSVPADRPLQQQQPHRQPRQPSPSPSPLPPPPEQQLRRAQTQQFPLADPDPSVCVLDLFVRVSSN